MEKWNCKTVVVTGGNSEIGLTILRKLAQAEMKAVGFDVHIDNLERLSKDYPGKIVYQQVDVCDYESLRRAFRYVEETCGGLDVLINNAGIMGKRNSFGEVEENMEGILKTIDTNNFSGSVRCCQLAYDLLKKKDFGYIINFCSMNRNFSTVSYTSNKYAMTVITEELRQELINLKNDKIRVTSIYPGPMKTEFSQQHPERLDVQPVKMFNSRGQLYEIPEESKSSGKQRVKPGDVADAIFYLLSTPNSVNITELTIR